MRIERKIYSNYHFEKEEVSIRRIKSGINSPNIPRHIPSISLNITNFNNKARGSIESRINKRKSPNLPLPIDSLDSDLEPFLNYESIGSIESRIDRPDSPLHPLPINEPVPLNIFEARGSIESRIDRPNIPLHPSPINEARGSIELRLNDNEIEDIDDMFKHNFNKNLKQIQFNNSINNINIIVNQEVESKKDERSFTIKENNEKDENNETSQNNEVNQNDKNKDSNNKQNKKINLNILYYFKNLKLTIENKDICSYFEMNLSGTFYGCHSLELFNNVCKKIIINKTKFILICSGSAAQKIFDFCSNMNEIREYYIYCKRKEKYLSLIDEFPKLKGVYDLFNELKEKLFTIDEIKINNIEFSILI